jgi:hypothetical protein
VENKENKVALLASLRFLILFTLDAVTTDSGMEFHGFTIVQRQLGILSPFEPRLNKVAFVCIPAMAGLKTQAF